MLVIAYWDTHTAQCGMAVLRVNKLVSGTPGGRVLVCVHLLKFRLLEYRVDHGVDVGECDQFVALSQVCAALRG